ncbi:nonribosomal peptide synthetase MxaA [Rhodovulum visakhapatnamense]|uniref:nonribosomal peptide synthetase MxaA n=1 Tax=Rhodovulum visakhapatnamense TaxID=364297 RepID=UPI002116B5A9
MIRLVLAFLALSAGARAAPDGPPREYGWWLGDQLVQTVTLDLPEGVSLDPASLPRPRGVAYWLDLVRVEAHETAGTARITLVWQNFYSALEPSRREVPAQPVRLSDGSLRDLPGFAFVTAPIRPIRAPSTQDQMRPDPDFRLVDPGPSRLGLVLSGAGLLSVAAALAFQQGLWPFHRRPARPLTRAARQLSRMRGAAPDEAARVLHRALDATCGRVLIGAELDRFIVQRPEFRPVQDRLATFFAASDARHFGRGGTGPETAGMRDLARVLAGIERGRR